MNIANFRAYETVQGVEFATVDVTTGTWWRSTTQRRVYKSKDSYGWHFLDTGGSVSGINEMVSAYHARAILSGSELVA